jgi:hypothetical protein
LNAEPPPEWRIEEVGMKSRDGILEAGGILKTGAVVDVCGFAVDCPEENDD